MDKITKERIKEIRKRLDNYRKDYNPYFVYCAPEDIEFLLNLIASLQ